VIEPGGDQLVAERFPPLGRREYQVLFRRTHMKGR
jgi:hypothetical protein